MQKVQTKLAEQEHLFTQVVDMNFEGSYQHHLQAIMNDGPRGRLRPQSANAVLSTSNTIAGLAVTTATASSNHLYRVPSQTPNNANIPSSSVGGGSVTSDQRKASHPLVSGSSSNYNIQSMGSKRTMSHAKLLPNNASSYQLHNRGRRGARMGDIGANTVFLGLSDRCGSDPMMQAWYRRIRNTPNGFKLFDSLRTILAHQRRRHNIRLTAQQSRRKICPVRKKYPSLLL